MLLNNVEDQVSQDMRKDEGPNAFFASVFASKGDLVYCVIINLWRLKEVPEDWRKENIIPVFKKGKREDSGKYKSVSLILILGKEVEQLILEMISRSIKDKKIIRRSHHGFTKGKSGSHA